MTDFNKLKKIISEAVKEALDPVGRTETGKWVGVGQARDIDNDGDVDSSDSYLAHRRKKITQSMKKRDDLSEEGYKKSTSFGEIPDADELWELMDGEEFDMNLKGQDSLAWEYANVLSPDPRAGSVSAGEGMRASLEALVNVPAPSELSDDQYEDVEHILDVWHERYGEEPIEEAAWSLASSIMEVLGVEWI